MENIEEILSSCGVELNDEQKKKFDEKFNNNYRTISDYQKQKDKLKLAQESLSETQTAFNTFKGTYEGVDVDDLKKQIKTLTQTIDSNKKEYGSNLSKLELKTKVKDALREKGCVDAGTAMLLLDVDDLMKSNNQDVDLANKIDGLAKEKSFLFAPKEKGKLNIGASTHGDDKEEQSFEDVLAEALS